MTLTSRIKKNLRAARFHTPGHSGTLKKSLLRCDITELSYSDNLLEPASAISDLENRLASAYGMQACFISTCGATSSVFQAVYAVKDDGPVLLVGNCHASVYNVLHILHADAYHIDGITTPDCIPASVKTVFITSPDYFGRCKDLAHAAAICKEKNLTLIIDAAHGSHFIFSDKLPVSATVYGDMVIHSLHKTLPVATGGSILLAKETYRARLNMARKIFHSSSPSYITICSIEDMLYKFNANGAKYYCAVKDKLDKFISSLNASYTVEKTDDFSRLVITSNFDPLRLNVRLLEEFLIAAEAVYGNALVFILTPYNYKKLPRLLRALNFLSHTEKEQSAASGNFVCAVHSTAFKLNFAQSADYVDIAAAAGAAAFSAVGIYPPGVPLIYPGQTVTQADVDMLLKNRGCCFGLVNGRLPVVK